MHGGVGTVGGAQDSVSGYLRKDAYPKMAVRRIRTYDTWGATLTLVSSSAEPQSV